MLYFMEAIYYIISNTKIVLLSNPCYAMKYCIGFDQRVARQQLCKHGPTRNNR
jgi:hypothetical protein